MRITITNIRSHRHIVKIDGRHVGTGDLKECEALRDELEASPRKARLVYTLSPEVQDE